MSFKYGEINIELKHLENTGKPSIFFAMPWNYMKIPEVLWRATLLMQGMESGKSPCDSLSLLVVKGESNGSSHCDCKKYPGSNIDCDTREIVNV